MNNKLLILYKTSILTNNIFNITYEYSNKYKNVDRYFVVCDENITEDYTISDNIIRIKIKNDNWASLLISVIKTFNIFKCNNYTHIMVSNISTYINIPIIYNKLLPEHCQSHTGTFTFKNIYYKFPSGAGYIFSNELVNNICNFFEENNFIINNKLSINFKNNYPTTDDIFFGFYLYKNNIEINELDRLNIIKPNFIITEDHLKYSHFRIKSLNSISDNKYFEILSDKLSTAII